jgi:hypothetical protein
LDPFLDEEVLKLGGSDSLGCLFNTETTFYRIYLLHRNLVLINMPIESPCLSYDTGEASEREAKFQLVPARGSHFSLSENSNRFEKLSNLAL